MMKKILQQLEKHVQWGTLALGAAFLGYMIWTFVFQNPASKPMTIGGSSETVSPGTVDRVIADGPATILEEKTRTQNPGFKIDVPPPPSLDLTKPSTTQPAVAAAFDSWPLDLVKIEPGPGENQNQPMCSALPVLPALNFLDQEPLRTVLSIPDASGGSNPTKLDQDSVTTFWALPIAPLAKAFAASFGKLPASQQRTWFVHADLIRQEQLPDGSWGPDVVVARVFNSPPPPEYPVAASAGFQDQAKGFSAWLTGTAGSQKSIVAADFPAVFYPDRDDLKWKSIEDWQLYRAKLQAQANVPPPPVGQFAPAPGAALNQTPAPPSGPPPAGGSGIFGGGPPAGGSGGGGPGSGGPGGGRHGRRGGPNGPGGQSAFGQPGGPNGPQGVRQQPKPAAPSPSPFAAAPEQAAPPPQPVEIPKLPPLQQVPDSAFDPVVLAPLGDVELYFHDLTVEPGKTYHYKVRYSLLNPVFGIETAVTDKKLAAVYGIDSPASDWSEPVAVPARTKFWCADKAPTGTLRANGLVHFTVFSWHDGQWTKRDYPSVAPGDEIGDGEFKTHYTLLDANSDESRQILIAPDDGGAAIARFERTDATSPEFQKLLQDLAAAQSAAPGAANGTAPPAQQTGLQAQPPGGG